MGKDSALLDWDITEAPDADEPMPSPVETVKRPRPYVLSRRTWLMLGGIILAVVVGVNGFSAWDKWRVLAGVRQVIAAETRPAPWPNSLLRPAGDEAAVVNSLTILADNTAQAEIARAYLTPAGQPVTFTLSQFYRFDGRDWQRIPIPETYWGPTHDYRGERVWIHYPRVDDEFVKDFGPYMDDILIRACAEWVCSRRLRLNLNFSLQADSPALPQPIPAGEPDTFRLMLAGVDVEQEIRIPSPHAAGYPADDASRAMLKRALALQALIGLANELAGSAAQRDNAYLYALTARLAARLGLESPDAGQSLTVQTFYEPGELWDMAYARIWQSPPARDEALRAALGSLNLLLAASDAPADADARLFASLRRNFASADWYADAMGLSSVEAREQLRQALRSIYRIDPLASTPDLLPHCSAISTVYLGDQSLTAFLPVTQSENIAVVGSWPLAGECDYDIASPR
jgi:hypothetical protein